MRTFILPVAVLVLSATASFAADDPHVIAADEGKVTVHPVEHASFVLEAGDRRIVVDPVGGIDRFTAYGGVDLALVTDIHGDHFDADTLRELVDQGAAIIAPAAVAKQMDEALRAATTVLANDEETTKPGFSVTAIPMYNLTEERLKFHPKGRGNGYVVELRGLRIYIAGDTEDTPEMRALEDIDVAFIPMNLPYTMDVEHAADAVIEMQPRIVYPYHYRGQEGLSDVGHFAELVREANPDIEVRQLDWYPAG